MGIGSCHERSPPSKQLDGRAEDRVCIVTIMMHLTCVGSGSDLIDIWSSVLRTAVSKAELHASSKGIRGVVKHIMWCQVYGRKGPKTMRSTKEGSVGRDVLCPVNDVRHLMSWWLSRISNIAQMLRGGKSQEIYRSCHPTFTHKSCPRRWRGSGAAGQRGSGVHDIMQVKGSMITRNVCMVHSAMEPRTENRCLRTVERSTNSYSEAWPNLTSSPWGLKAENDPICHTTAPIGGSPELKDCTFWPFKPKFPSFSFPQRSHPI